MASVRRARRALVSASACFSASSLRGHVKPLQASLARHADPRGTRGLGRNGRIGSGKTGMERTGESRGRIAGNIVAST